MKKMIVILSGTLMLCAFAVAGIAGLNGSKSVSGLLLANVEALAKLEEVTKDNCYTASATCPSCKDSWSDACAWNQETGSSCTCSEHYCD